MHYLFVPHVTIKWTKALLIGSAIAAVGLAGCGTAAAPNPTPIQPTPMLLPRIPLPDSYVLTSPTTACFAVDDARRWFTAIMSDNATAKLALTTSSQCVTMLSGTRAKILETARPIPTTVAEPMGLDVYCLLALDGQFQGYKGYVTMLRSPEGYDEVLTSDPSRPKCGGQ